MAADVGEFDEDSAERIADAVRWVESQPGNRRPPPRGRKRTSQTERQFVRVTSTTVTSGTQPGKLQTLTAGVLSDGADVLVSEANGSVLGTQIYEGRLVAVDPATGKATFMVDARGKANWIRFHLVTTLASTDASQAGCPVDAYWQGSNPGATVTVWNPPASTNYLFSGSTGKVGLASWDEAAGKYWIVQMEC